MWPILRFGLILASLFVAAAAVFAGVLSGQGTTDEEYAVIQGTVTDAQHKPLAGVVVSVSTADTKVERSALTDEKGAYSVQNLAAGTYTVRVERSGQKPGVRENIAVPQNQTVTVDFVLENEAAPSSSAKAAAGVEFSDSPNFTVAGVTDPTNLGGHGSDVALRTRESLARATASLNRANIEEEKRRAEELRGKPDSAELHEVLGDIAENEGRPLDAVKEYERAASMDPTEANLFAWGAELLLHRAPEPASEVFEKGRKKYPRSSRMLIGLGVASFALGQSDEAAKLLAAACDIDPADPTPYVFLGKMQSGAKIEPAGWIERLARFAKLAPQNAMAHYYYAVALSKGTEAERNSPEIESSLQRAIELDPKSGDAYLQLGILYADRKDFAKAIEFYQKAIENTPLPDEAHYRLAEAYRRSGQADKAHEEIQQYEKISKEKTQANEQARHEISQFVYTLRGDAAATKP